ncbi:hypothetical protein TWF730_010491 [Orbilia blumenaviensis]|uniref:Uncharacterized protein n=1 Tax=Orbilia blumenaviensis TaxID=1796055 RepID=A0AAV9UP80_9PEZI
MSRFTPIPGVDVVSYRWKDGNKKIHEVEMPRYCIALLAQTEKNIIKYILYHASKYSKLLESAEPTGYIFDMAMKYARLNKGTMVSDALYIWFVSRMTEEDWSIYKSDADKFDMSPIPPWSEKTLVTPMMDTQLDQIIVRSFLKPVRSRLLPKLQEKLLAGNPKDWFDIFLTLFVLLTSIEKLGKHADKFRRRYGVLKEGRIPRGMDPFFHDANVLLAYFHRIYQGSAPFRDDWQNPDTAKKRNMTEDQAEFIQYLQREIMPQEKRLKGMRNQKLQTYTQPMYWSHQLFFDDWNPS